MKKQTKLILLRWVLALLILANMTVIFLFSMQNGEQSSQTSGAVSKKVAEITVPNFEEKPQEEQDRIVASIHPPMRKVAHAVEFGTLGALVFLFLSTWKGGLAWRYTAALAFTFLYACSDELHQMYTDARGPQFSDVMIDLSGALVTCTVLLVILVPIRKRRGTLFPWTQITHRTLPVAHLTAPLCAAVLSDLHGEKHQNLLDRIAAERPDVIFIPGDLADDKQLADPHHHCYDFLRGCAAIAPTFYSFGNHEIACYHKGNHRRHPVPIKLPQEVYDRIRATGVMLLDGACATFREITVCGIGSGINGEKNEPDQALLSQFSRQSAPRILLCHHPEYFVPYIKDTDIELTVSGHAHGGQWRAFGRGAYAPGQGVFPKYTAGVLEGRCVISRGLGNHTPYPRFFNPREVVILHLIPKSKA